MQHHWLYLFESGSWVRREDGHTNYIIHWVSISLSHFSSIEDFKEKIPNWIIKLKRHDAVDIHIFVVVVFVVRKGSWPVGLVITRDLENSEWKYELEIIGNQKVGLPTKYLSSVGSCSWIMNHWTNSCSVGLKSSAFHFALKWLEFELWKNFENSCPDIGGSLHYSTWYRTHASLASRTRETTGYTFRLSRHWQ